MSSLRVFLAFFFLARRLSEFEASELIFYSVLIVAVFKEHAKRTPSYSISYSEGNDGALDFSPLIRTTITPKSLQATDHPQSSTHTTNQSSYSRVVGWLALKWTKTTERRKRKQRRINKKNRSQLFGTRSAMLGTRGWGSLRGGSLCRTKEEKFVQQKEEDEKSRRLISESINYISRLFLPPCQSRCQNRTNSLLLAKSLNECDFKFRTLIS